MIEKKILSVLMSVFTVISLVPLFATGASASMLEQTDPLVRKVAQYCMEIDRSLINKVNGYDLTNVDEYNKYVSAVNLINNSKKPSRDLFYLAGDDNVHTGDGFVAHNLRNGMSDNLVLRATLGMSGLVFNDELVGWIAGENADVEKYKSALESFMEKTESRIKCISTVKSAISYLKAISKTVDTAKATETVQSIMLAVYESKSAEDINAALKASELERVLNGTEEISVTSELSEVLGVVGDTLKITSLTAEGIESIINVEANFKIYKQYEDFLTEIINDKSLPRSLRLAAKEIYPNIVNLYAEAVKSFKDAAVKYGISKGISLSAKAIVSGGASAAITDFLGAYGVAKVLVGHLFSAKEIVKGCAAIECYDMLAEKYADMVLNDKRNFISNPTLENAQKFREDYEYLQQLRLSGEKTYLTMIGFDKSWDPIQRTIMRTATGYKENKTFLKQNIEMIEATEFTTKDTGETYNIKLRKFYDTTANVQCPVNVKVYDKGNNLVASVINNEIQDIDADGSDFPIVVYTEDDEKIIRMVSSNDYRIEIEAYGSGKMTYTSTKKTAYDELVYKTSYEDMEITTGDSFEAKPENETEIVGRTLYKTTGSEPLKLEPTDDYDNKLLPKDDSDVAEVVVAEELFEGFSKELIDKVADAMFSYSASVDISSFNISTKDTVALFSAIAKYYPSEYSILSRTDFTYRIVFSPSRKIITGIRFYYDSTFSADAYKRRVSETNAAIDALVAKTKGMNDFEKALYVHDYIVLNCEYDLDLLNLINADGTLDGEIYSERYTEYSVLVNGTGICGSYALAYRAVMNACGVECLYLSSREMNHAWNMIKLDGKWYHVDCCWDDPVPDRYGVASRTYFLRTDDEIMELNHYSWTPNEYKATGSKYSSMPRYCDTVQKYENGSWYYLESGSLYKSDSTGGNKKLVSAMTASTFDVEGGEIYYSYGREIYDMNEKSGETTLSYCLPDKLSGTKREYTYLRNLYVDGESVTAYRGIYGAEDYEYIKNTQSNILGTVGELKLNYPTLTLGYLEAKQLECTLTQGDDTCTVDPNWIIDSKTVAAFEKNGKVTGKINGTMNITAYIGDKSTTCNVTVSYDIDTTDKTLSLRYIIENGEVTITGCDRAITGELVIPDSIDGYPVTSICSWAFDGCAGLTSITIGNSVTSIGDYAFDGCAGLTSITIPDSVTSIGEGAFYNTGYYDNTNNWDNNVLYIGNHLIEVNSGIIGSYTIKNGTRTIADCAFDGCTGLTSITIGNSVTSIGSWAFYGCTGLTSITIPDSVTSIGDWAFARCTGLISITIPDSVTSIGWSAFSGCAGLTSITIPDSVTSIGEDAFYHTGYYNNTNNWDNNVLYIGNHLIEVNSEIIGSYTIKNGTRTIADCAFYGCTGLTSITIPDSVTSIGYSAFLRCTSLADVYYAGSEEQWNKIIINSDNECLTNATIHYNYTPHEHSYTPVLTKAATCTEDGVMTYTCSSCGDSYTETVKAPGHSYKLVSSVAATCLTSSVSKFKCENCGKEITITGKETDKHTYVITIHGATCTDYGYTEGTCSECNDSVMYDFVSPLGHDLTVTRTPATCKEHSKLEYACSRCDYREIVIDTDSALADHSYQTSVVEPTCTEEGYTAYTCSVCGEGYKEDYVPANGHTDGEWKIVTPATVKSEGKRELRCKDCGEVLKTESIPKLEPVGKVKSVNVNDVNLNYKASTTLKPTVIADEGVEYTVKYSTSNPKVATVDENGKVTATKRGTATITCTVTDSNGNTVQDTCKVTVKYTWWQWIITVVLFGWIWY